MNKNKPIYSPKSLTNCKLLFWLHCFCYFSLYLRLLWFDFQYLISNPRGARFSTDQKLIPGACVYPVDSRSFIAVEDDATTGNSTYNRTQCPSHALTFCLWTEIVKSFPVATARRVRCEWDFNGKSSAFSFCRLFIGFLSFCGCFPPSVRHFPLAWKILGASLNSPPLLSRSFVIFCGAWLLRTCRERKIILFASHRSPTD